MRVSEGNPSSLSSGFPLCFPSFLSSSFFLINREHSIRGLRSVEEITTANVFDLNTLTLQDVIIAINMRIKFDGGKNDNPVHREMTINMRIMID
jgi:hypothetical protein